MKKLKTLRNGARVRFACSIRGVPVHAGGVISSAFMDGGARFYELRRVSWWYRAELRIAGLPDARVIRAARDIIE